MSLFKSLRRLNASSTSRDLLPLFEGVQPLDAASTSRDSIPPFEGVQPLDAASTSRDSIPSFEGVQPLDASSTSGDSTPTLEGVQAPFAQVGSAPHSAPVLPREYDEDTERIRNRFYRFRALIIGRANSGKTTILQKVCGTTKEPDVLDVRGDLIKARRSELERLRPLKFPMRSSDVRTRKFPMPSGDRGLHDINNTMVFASNPGFIFHDSRGFESGSAQELDAVTTFLSDRSKSTELQDQVHAVWYCIPLDDDRPFTRAEINFFSECGTGSVPVIVIFTKFDAMDDKAFGKLIEQGLSTDEARARAPDHAAVMFERDVLHVLYGMKYPPKSHVLLRDMNHPQASCKELVDCTASVIDNDVLKLLFVSNQRNNLALCMQSAMKELRASFTDFPAIQIAFMKWFPHTVLRRNSDSTDHEHHKADSCALTVAVDYYAPYLKADPCTLDLAGFEADLYNVDLTVEANIYTWDLTGSYRCESGLHAPYLEADLCTLTVELLASPLSFTEVLHSCHTKADVMEFGIQRRLERLVQVSGESSKASSAVAVFIIILELSFFFWDKKPSHKCFSQALGVYEKATSNHEAVMRAVEDTSGMKQDSEEEKKAFLARMTEIVLSHRLSDSYRAETGTG
ncbi:hypothetical protein FIBSPDRAFT_998546 [Athelia psychrophila]|uniref:G domain-containing protein n=1 Tax=Athelia psychrophila TaxID=1759441 RepID=A0A167XH31_9AGAM|nr:hypothetical protein FIBSPDRAFT_998546 [Fibularhizoctonia sp. CBS 109695]